VKEIPADEFAARLDALRGLIKAVLRSYCIPPADAEDVMQEVFLVVVRMWESIKNFEAFVIGVTRNQCRRWVKRHLRERSVLTPLIEDFEAAAIEPPQQSVERAVRLQEVLAPLRPKERQALRLRSFGLTREQIGAALGLATASVGNLYVRAMRRIRELEREPYSLKPAARWHR
jgi:RNA polymerase sigma factor (sigma-70 family)